MSHAVAFAAAASVCCLLLPAAPAACTFCLGCKMCGSLLSFIVACSMRTAYRRNCFLWGTSLRARCRMEECRSFATRWPTRNVFGQLSCMDVSAIKCKISVAQCKFKLCNPPKSQAGLERVVVHHPCSYIRLISS